MDVIFDQARPFSTSIGHIITVALFHVITLFLETYVVFYYGHPDDDKYNYGLISKMFVILGMHVATAFFICLSTDFATGEYVSGYITGFRISTFWLLTYISKEITCYIILRYASYFMDADNDKGWFRPWSKALVWTVFKSLGILLFYFILYGIMTSFDQDYIECHEIYLSSPDQRRVPNWGDPLCIPKCITHWRFDPSICLEYKVSEQKTITKVLDGFIVINQILGVFVNEICCGIGFFCVPYQCLKKLRNTRKPNIKDETSLKVAHAEIAEMAKALGTIGKALMERRIAFSKLKKRRTSFAFWSKTLGLRTDSNRYTKACYILFDHAELVETRRIRGSKELKGEGNVFTLPMAWIKFIFALLCSLCILIGSIVLRLSNTPDRDNSLYTASNLILNVIFDLGFFPLTVLSELAILSVNMYYSLRGFRGLFNVLPIATPFRSTRKSKVRMREMIKMCFMMLFVITALPYKQSVLFSTVSNASWSSRNLISTVINYTPTVFHNAIPEWMGMISGIVWLILALIRPPSAYPWGLTKTPLDKADDLQNIWSGKKKGRQNRFERKMDEADSKLKSKGNSYKTGAVMKVGKAQAGI